MASETLTALLVEDNPADVALLTELLQDGDAKSWQITNFKRLSQALAELQSKEFDVILLDLSLPDSQGVDTVMQVYTAVPHIPIVVLTGLPDKNLALQAVAKGAQDYLVKGQISPELLVKTIEYAIERSQIVSKLQQREREFRTLVENTPDIIARHDRQHRYVYINPAITREFGIATATFLGKTPSQLNYPQENSQFLENCLENALTTGKIQIEEFQVTNQDEAKTYQIYVVPEFAVDGSVDSVVTIARNITKLRQTEAAFAESETLNRMKDEFLAMLSHELRTPLNPILGWTRLLQTRSFSSEQTKTALATIERNAQRQAQLVEDLLDLSQMLRGQLKLKLAAVQLIEPINAAIKTARLAAQSKSIEIETVLNSHLGYVRGDAIRLQQVMEHLLSNAVKFTPNGGKITIRLEQIADEAQITVSDNGKGIKPSFLPFVFERFRQEDSSNTRQFGGLGLGLALVRQILEAHGGTVSAASPGEGQGAIFTVRLPLLSSSLAITPQQPDESQVLNLAGVKILLVEDEPDSCDLIVWVLEQAGASVTAATSATVALNVLAHSKFDVMVSDIGLPDLDGYSLLKQVRALPSAQELTAIALTAFAGEVNQQTALAAGYQQHLSKPIEPDILVLKIAEVIGANS
ncbi:MAG TPA: response regulator [Leptolyngbyaceae cyanobacterium]